MSLPTSPAAERNKGPLLAALRDWLGADAELAVLEIGSGTGQHACHFVRALTNLRWQTADLPANHDAILARLRHDGCDRILPPLALDMLTVDRLPTADLVFTANTFHIMPWPAVCRALEMCGDMLHDGGRLIVYGPFNVGNAYTSQSNAGFDASLRSAGAGQGLRNREDVCRQADAAGLSLTRRRDMPANNQLLCFERRARPPVAGV